VEISVLTFPHRHAGSRFLSRQVVHWLRVLLLISLLQSVSSAATYPINESFKTNTSSGWTLGPVLSGTAPTTATPCPADSFRPAFLTSGNLDAANDGWLRLTDNCQSQKGYAIFDTPFSTPQGVSIEFEYKTWGGTHADGLTVFLFDGATASSGFNTGDFGGSLGYANGCTAAGATTGYLGLGLDEYGNFSNPSDRCKNGGIGTTAIPQRVTLRGAANDTTPYPYLTQSGALANSIDDSSGATSRPADSVFFRKVLILIEPVDASVNPAYRITVKWQTTVGGTYTTILGPYTMPTKPPPTLKIGFAASTGGSTNFHEIRNLSIQKPTNLTVVKTLSSGFTPPLNPLAQISYTLKATNAGPNAVTDAALTDSVPSLIENVAYTCVASLGSSCSSSSGTVSSNNLNLSLTMPLSGTVTVTVTGTLKATAASRTLSNTALLSLPDSSEFNDLDPNDNSSTVNTLINGFSISGLVFLDANANSYFDNGLETRITTGTYRPILTGTDDLGNPIGPITATAVTPSAANQFQSYTFPNLPVGVYALTGVSRAALTPGEIFTTPSALAVQITASSVINQWFGYFQGRKLTGSVFIDDGHTAANATTLANANNALQNPGEFGAQNISVTANGSLLSGGTAVSTLAKTDLQGFYTLWVPSTWSANVTVSHTSSVPTGTNQNGANIVLASSFEAASARRIALTGQVNGSVYGGLNFGLVSRNVLQPDQFGSTSSPGSVRYLHLFRPGTTGNLTLGTSSSGGFRYIFYLDSNCDGVIDVAEHDSPMTTSTITVDASWPRETSGGLKACALEVEVLAPAGKAPTVVDIATITGAMVWTNNAAVTDSARVIDTTKLSGVSGNIQLYKAVRNVSQDAAGGVTTPTYKTSVGGKPGVAGTIGEELEYCIGYKNVGTTPISSMVVTDPIPFFTNFKLGSISLNGFALPDGTTVADGFITVGVGVVGAGVGGTVCYRVTIK
jgi:uncharacterized repeat protein (TIGR01451 family)